MGNDNNKPKKKKKQQPIEPCVVKTNEILGDKLPNVKWLGKTWSIYFKANAKNPNYINAFLQREVKADTQHTLTFCYTILCSPLNIKKTSIQRSPKDDRNIVMITLNCLELKKHEQITFILSVDKLQTEPQYRYFPMEANNKFIENGISEQIIIWEVDKKQIFSQQMKEIESPNKSKDGMWIVSAQQNQQHHLEMNLRLCFLPNGVKKLYVKFSFECDEMNIKQEVDKTFSYEQFQHSIIFEKWNNIDSEHRKLYYILKQNDLYDELHDILVKNEFDFRVLKNDIEEQELTDSEFKEFGIKSDHVKLKFLRLLKIVKDRVHVIVIGDMNIGKKSLIKRYIYNKYIDDENNEEKQQYWNKQQALSASEDVMDLNIKIISDINELNNNLLIDVIMVCYDISNEETFINCCKLSNNILKYKQEINNKLITILVGLKSDIQNIDRKIEDENAEKIKNMNEWKSLNIDDCQCSAKTGKNVNSLFLSAAELIHIERKQ